MDIEEKFAKRVCRAIKKEILEQDLSVETLAQHLGISRPTILNYMDGHSGNFTPMFRLMKLLGINPNDLYRENNVNIQKFKRIRTALSVRRWCRAKKVYSSDHRHNSCNLCKALYRKKYREKGGN